MTDEEHRLPAKLVRRVQAALAEVGADRWRFDEDKGAFVLDGEAREEDWRTIWQALGVCALPGETRGCCFACYKHELNWEKRLGESCGARWPTMDCGRTDRDD